MNIARLALLLTLALSACQKGEVIDVTLLPNGQVRIALPEGDDLTCIRSISIGRYQGENYQGEVWSIEDYDNAHCHRSVEFPNAPAGFKVLKPASQLQPGRYSVIGYDYGMHLRGEFTVPVR